MRDVGRNKADLHEELIPISRIGGHRQPERSAGLIEGCPVGLEYRNAAVVGQLEECRLGSVRRAHGDLLVPAGLLDAQLFLEVTNYPLLNVRGLNEPRSALLDEAHRVEGGLQRPRGVVNEALLMPTDNRRAFGELELAGYHVRGQLDLYPRQAGLRLAAMQRHLRKVAHPVAFLPRARQDRDKKVDLIDDEGSLTRARLH